MTHQPTRSRSLGCVAFAALVAYLSCSPSDEFSSVKTPADLYLRASADSLLAKSPHFSGRVRIALSDTVSLGKMLDGIGMRLLSRGLSGSSTPYSQGLYLEVSGVTPLAALQPVIAKLGQRRCGGWGQVMIVDSTPVRLDLAMFAQAASGAVPGSDVSRATIEAPSMARTGASIPLADSLLPEVDLTDSSSAEAARYAVDFAFASPATASHLSNAARMLGDCPRCALRLVPRE